MSSTLLRSFATVSIIACCSFQNTRAQELRITIPMRSELTTVQRLNREGVESIRKQQFDKGEALFLKAYLYDPADPFTLNNLGYIAELQGQLDRAQRFYALASKQGDEALIDQSNARQLEGRPMREALGALKDTPMRINRMNIDAISLLSQNQNDEAELLLRQALKLDTRNPFTLNNLGVVEEAVGDDESALKYYDAAAATRSMEPIVITLKSNWRGRPVSQMAAFSAAQVRGRVEQMGSAEERAAMLTLRGVSATNRNDWSAARQDFLEAYKLDPSNAFSLNNRGYVAEKDGDLETAGFYYGEAAKAQDANARIGVASQTAVEGKRLAAVASESNEQVSGKLDAVQQARRRAGRPVELKRRDETPAEPPAPQAPAPAAQPQPQT